MTDLQTRIEIVRFKASSRYTENFKVSRHPSKSLTQTKADDENAQESALESGSCHIRSLFPTDTGCFDTCKIDFLRFADDGYLNVHCLRSADDRQGRSELFARKQAVFSVEVSGVLTLEKAIQATDRQIIAAIDALLPRIGWDKWSIEYSK